MPTDLAAHETYFKLFIICGLSAASLISCSASKKSTNITLATMDNNDIHHSDFDCKAGSVEYALSSSPSTDPLFENSVYPQISTFITAQDNSEFRELTFIGRSKKEMPDRRTNELFDNTAFVFEAVFSDTTLEIWLHSDFEQLQAASTYAQMLMAPIGRLPSFMRQGLKHVVVHSGDEVAFGEHIGNFFVVYSENMERRLSSHGLEETVFHESVHATLDLACEHTDSSWNEARVKDNAYITAYAAELPEKEDLAESCTVRVHHG